MIPDPSNLLEIAGIETPLIGFYDVPDRTPFEPFAALQRCIFSSYAAWLKGERISISVNDSFCRGGRYWVGGVEFASRDDFADDLNAREGFKASPARMNTER